MNIKHVLATSFGVAALLIIYNIGVAVTLNDVAHLTVAERYYAEGKTSESEFRKAVSTERNRLLTLIGEKYP